jgi:amino acid transporter
VLLVIGAQFYCGMSSVTANSRMIYAFARDGAIPGSRFWHRIKAGPWNLGRWSRPIGIVATIWVVFIAILFLLPQVTPIDRPVNFNYAPVAVGAVLPFAGGWWLISAKNWFKGPKVQGSPEELAAIERDLTIAETTG